MILRLPRTCHRFGWVTGAGAFETRNRVVDGACAACWPLLVGNV